MRDAALDPSTGDYTGQALEDLGNAVYLRLATPLGSWWADPELGSRLHELQREKNKPRVRTLAVQYAESALQPLIRDGRARSVTVSAEGVTDASGGGRCLLRIEVEDNTGGATTYEHPVKVG